jgi:sugar/nucleoside kinase (ribokinase family)
MRFPFKLPAGREFDVAGFGTNAVDYLVTVPEYPRFNSKTELTDYRKMAGGEIASALVGLARLGMRTAYAGRFGADAEGDFGLQTLRDENVNVDHAERVAGAPTQVAFILIDEPTGERTVIWKRDARLAYSENDAPLEITKKCRVFHATPHDARACARMAESARRAGAVVSIDIDNLFDSIERLLPLVDIFISSEEFPEKLTGTNDRRKALREIRASYGCAIVGMTLGARGSLLLCEDRFIETPGCAVPGGCRDTTGAGDAFRAGFLYGLITGETVETAAHMANAAAALKCRALGARTALPNVGELKGLMDNSG